MLNVSKNVLFLTSINPSLNAAKSAILPPLPSYLATLHHHTLPFPTNHCIRSKTNVKKLAATKFPSVNGP